MLLRGVKHEYFASLRGGLQPARFEHLSNVNIVRILRPIPLFHLLEHFWRTEGVVADVLVGRQLQVLGYLCVAIVALLVVTFELFESVLILACRPVLGDEDLGGLGSVWVLQVLEDFKGTSLGDRAIVGLIGLPV